MVIIAKVRTVFARSFEHGGLYALCERSSNTRSSFSQTLTLQPKTRSTFSRVTMLHWMLVFAQGLSWRGRCPPRTAVARTWSTSIRSRTLALVVYSRIPRRTVAKSKTRLKGTKESRRHCGPTIACRTQQIYNLHYRTPIQRVNHAEGTTVNQNPAMKAGRKALHKSSQCILIG